MFVIHEAASGDRSALSRKQRGVFLRWFGKCPGYADNEARCFGFVGDVRIDFFSDTARLFVYGILAPVD